MFCVIADTPPRESLAGDPGEGREDPDTGFEGTAEGAGDLRTTGQAPAVGHWKLEDPEPGAGRPHLHFEVPAVGHFVHIQPIQRIGADSPERAHIAIAHSVDETDGSAD